jgi:hypothetical protein
MSWKVLKPVIGVGAALAAATAIVVEWNQLSRLQLENDELRAQAQQAREETAQKTEQLKALMAARQPETPSAELLRLRGEVGRLRSEVARLSAAAQDAERSRQGVSSMFGPPVTAAYATNTVTPLLPDNGWTEQMAKRYGLPYARPIDFESAQVKQVGTALLRFRQANPNAAILKDGQLNPQVAAYIPDGKWDQVEVLVADASALGKLIEEAPSTIVARSKSAVAVPGGRWRRFYVLANGSLNYRIHDTPDEVLSGAVSQAPTAP